MEPSRSEIEALIREKYQGNQDADGVEGDLARLKAGEPLAYVIGNIPFLGLTITLGSHPLIPRPETEWWTEELIKHIGSRKLRVLDMCAGSGAIGLALLKYCTQVQISFGELVPEHALTITENLKNNGLDAERATIHTGDLFSPFKNEVFDIIAANPPYIPENRPLDAGVTEYEPKEALFAGSHGMDVIERIVCEAPSHLSEQGELWMECDVENIHAAKGLCEERGFKKNKILTDHYGRERVLVAQL